MDDHSITIEYALTRSEIVRSFLGSVAESSKYRDTILLYSAAIGAFVFLLRTNFLRSLTLRDGIIAVAWAVGLLVFTPIWVFIRGKTSKRTLTVSSDGISTEIGRLRAQVPWRKVKMVNDTGQFVLIARTNGNAFFVPNRAFSGPEQRSLFLEEIKRWMHA